jgi:hypothetical protein
LDERGVTFRWKDHRVEGRTRHKVMTLTAEGFMRRFLLHVLPSGFHLCHFGLLANPTRKKNIDVARALLQVPAPATPLDPDSRNTNGSRPLSCVDTAARGCSASGSSLAPNTSADHRP